MEVVGVLVYVLAATAVLGMFVRANDDQRPPLPFGVLLALSIAWPLTLAFGVGLCLFRK